MTIEKVCEEERKQFLVSFKFKTENLWHWLQKVQVS